MLGINLGNLLGDIDFWGGVAEGASTELDRQRDTKDKTVRELRNFAVESGMKINEENATALRETEDSIKEVAYLIAGNRNIRTKAVREAAAALIERSGGSLAAAAAEAKKFKTQYDTFGRDPIKGMGFIDTDAPLTGESPTYSQIARRYTKLKPMPKLSNAQIEGINDKTALDQIFGGKGAIEMATEQASVFIGDDVSKQTEAAFEPRKLTYDAEMILGDNLVKEEGRMYALREQLELVPPDQRSPDYDSKLGAIAENLYILKTARTNIKEKTSMTVTERQSLENNITGLIQDSAGLAGKYDPKNYRWIPLHDQVDISRSASDAATININNLNIAMKEGLKGILEGTNEELDPFMFTRQAAIAGYRTKIVKGTDGAPDYLTYGAKIFDRSSTAFQKALKPAALTSTKIIPPQGGGPKGQQPPPPKPVGVATYKPSQRVQALLPKLSDPIPSQRKATARAIMVSIKSAVPGKTDAEYEKIYENTTGMKFDG